MLKLAINGAAGRMGQTLIAAALADSRFKLVTVSEKPESISALKLPPDIAIVATSQALVEKTDAVIDFTAPSSTLALAEAVATKGAVHIIGTTGFSDAQQKQLESFASKARIVQSGNFSLGVNLLAALVEQAAKALDDRYDIELFEMHHKHKKDAPSGTALMLGRAAAKGRGVDLESKKKMDRDGERKRGDIGFSVARGGDVVGIHDVMLAGPGETITLSHQGFDRSIYASGALAAALWAKDQKPGLYSMRDVLGF